MHKHMATLFENLWAVPHTLETPYHFSVAQPPIEGRCPVHKAAVSHAAPHASPQNCATRLGATRAMLATPTPQETPYRVSTTQSPSGGFARPQGGLCLRCTARIAAHRRRIVPRRLGATCPCSATPTPTGNTLPHFRNPIYIQGAFSYLRRRPLPTLRCVHCCPLAQNRARPLGTTRPSPPPPPQWETPCRVFVTQSPNEGRCSIHKAAVAAFQLPPLAWIAVLTERRRPVRDCTSWEIGRAADRCLAPAVLLLPPSRLDAAVRFSCYFAGKRWPWLQRAWTTT